MLGMGEVFRYWDYSENAFVVFLVKNLDLFHEREHNRNTKRDAEEVMIYLDNAATTLKKPPEVIEAVVQAMKHMGNSDRGTHENALSASRIIYDTRESLADLFGCPGADHVVFTSNATEALNIAISGLIKKNDHVISTDLEHNSVLRPLYRMEQERAVQLSFVGADSQGNIDYGEFESLIQENTSAIVCTHASNLTGNLVDIERVGRIAREHNLLFIVDASQTAGVFPIDMERMNIDVLCFTGHKSLMGPQGTGGLCINTEKEVAPWKVGGSGVKSFSKIQPKELPTALEAGTLNGHGIAGLGAAVRFIQETGIDKIRAHEQQLMQAFYEGISRIRSITVYGDFESKERAPVVALNIGDYDSAQVSDELSEDFGIAVRSGAHCAPRMHQALGTVEQGAVRFSFSWFNTMEEVESAVKALREMAGENNA